MDFKIINQVGLATYSIYLLHPIVFKVVSYSFGKEDTLYIKIIAFITTIIAGIITYRVFETFFINLGKKLTSVK